MHYSGELRRALLTLRRFSGSEFDLYRQPLAHGHTFRFYTREEAEALSNACAVVLNQRDRCLAEARVIDQSVPLVNIDFVNGVRLSPAGAMRAYVPAISAIVGDNLLVDGALVFSEGREPVGVQNSTGAFVSL